MKNKTLYIHIGLIALTTSANSVDAQILNGDFSSGVTNWTVLQEPSGTVVGGSIASIDIDGPGLLGVSDAYYCQPGIGDQRSLQQSIFLLQGMSYNFKADLAMEPNSNNADGGTVQVFVGPTLITSFSFGTTTYGVNEYANLSATYVPALSGVQTLAINFARGYYAGGGTPLDFIDNVQLAPVPEPGVGTLTLGALVLLALVTKRTSREHAVA
jgi:hypothetical protein